MTGPDPSPDTRPVRERGRTALWFFEHRAVQLSVIVALGLALRLNGMASMPLWADELYTSRFARNDLAEILAMKRTLHPPGYLILSRLALAITDADWVVRIPALLGGLGGLVVMFLGARSLLGARLAAIAAATLAVCVYHVYFSQEARGYSWMSCLSGAAFFCAVRYRIEPRPRLLAGTLALCFLAPCFHYLAAPSCAVVVGALALFDGGRAWRSRDQLSWRRGAGALLPWAIFALICGLGLAISAHRMARVGNVLEASASTRVAVGPEFVAGVLSRWSGLGRGVGWIALVLLLAGVAELWRRDRFACVLVVLVVAAPFAVVGLLPWPHRFESRYLMAAMLPVIMLCALGLSTVLKRATSIAGLSRPAVSRATTLVAVVAILGAQLGVTLRQVVDPRKHTPAMINSAFGHRFLIFHNLLDPWMMRVLTTEDLERRDIMRVGPLVGPMPDWRVVSLRTKADNHLLFKLVNDRADDVLIFRLQGPDLGSRGSRRLLIDKTGTAAGPTEKLVNTKVQVPISEVTGEALGLVVLEGRFQPSGVQFLARLESVKTEAGLEYLRELERRVRYLPKG